MRTKLSALLTLSFIIATPAFASADLAAKKNCTTCHSASTKMLGPTWQDIAAKYKGQKGADATLADKIVKGGGGVWGPTPMPPNAAVSADDAKTLAKWALGGGQ